MLIVLICKPYCRAITGAHTPKKEEGVYNYSHQNTFDNHHIRARSFPRTFMLQTTLAVLEYLSQVWPVETTFYLKFTCL